MSFTDALNVAYFIKNTLEGIRDFDNCVKETTTYLSTLETTIKSCIEDPDNCIMTDTITKVNNCLLKFKEDVVYIHDHRYQVKFFYKERYKAKFSDYIDEIQKYLAVLNVFVAKKTIEIHKDVKNVATNVEEVGGKVTEIRTTVATIQRKNSIRGQMMAKQLEGVEDSNKRVEEQIAEMKKLFELSIAGNLAKMGEHKQEMDIQEVSKALDENENHHDNESDLDIEQSLKKAKQLQEEGKYQESLILMLKYRTMLRQEGEDEDTLDTANMWREMGEAHLRQGKYPEAMKFFEKELALRLKLQENNGTAVAGTYNNMAIVYQKQGKYDEALEYYEKSLNIRLEKLGDDHPDVADTKYNLALLYKNKLDNKVEAKKLFEDCVRIYTTAYGEDHTETIDAKKKVESCI